MTLRGPYKSPYELIAIKRDDDNDVLNTFIYVVMKKMNMAVIKLCDS